MLFGGYVAGPKFSYGGAPYLRRWTGKGIVCAWAHSIGIGIYALVTLLGLAVVLKKAPLVFNGIAILGALYLAWMGVQALRSKGGMQAKLAAGGDEYLDRSP